jgi:hypothetical protein
MIVLSFVEESEIEGLRMRISLGGIAKQRKLRLAV